MQITDLAEWIRSIDEPSVAPLTALGDNLVSFVELGLGYLSLEHPPTSSPPAPPSPGEHLAEYVGA